MKTLVTAAAILAFTAGTAAAMGGCGSFKAASKVAELDTTPKQESVAQTPAPKAETPTRVQTAEKPDEAQQAQD